MPLAPNRSPPNPVDVHVGGQIRKLRKMVGVTQERLAERLGLTFQQVQKYERGSNRVSASKLFEIAAVLQCSIGYFFEGLGDPGRTANGGVAESGEPFEPEFTATPEGRELVSSFRRIKEEPVRRRVIDLVKTLADKDEQAA